MKQWILIILILLTCFLSFANETTSYAPRDYSPIPPSPQVASIMKYNETPVNYFTGVPDISVPIFTVQSGNLSIPIALKYHGELLQTVNYYASGVPFTLTQGESATDRLHSGKQFIDHQGLGYYDNSARMLDVLGGRFTTLDPMATDYGHLSPYTNCAANPLKYTDPDGRILRDENGNIVYITTRETTFLIHPTGSTWNVEIGHIFTNDMTPVKVYKNIENEVKWDTNCHGTTFADGKYWINPDQVKNILKGDNYSYILIADAQKGDKIIYNDDFFADHSMTIFETNGTLEETIVYGQGGLDAENQIIEAINAWTNPQKHLIVRQKSKDVIVTNEKIRTLIKQQYE